MNTTLRLRKGSMLNSKLQFTTKDDWFTPKYIYDFFNYGSIFPIDYDPCTTKEQAKRFGIKNYDTIESDGLKSNWFNYHHLWINPPFSKKFEFLEKACELIRCTKEYEFRTVFIVLPFESLDTKKFHEIIGELKYSLHLFNGRINYENGKGKSPAFATTVVEIKSGNFLQRSVIHPVNLKRVKEIWEDKDE